MVERTPLRGSAPPKGPMWAQSCLIWIGRAEPSPVYSGLFSRMSGSALLKKCFASLVLKLGPGVVQLHEDHLGVLFVRLASRLQGRTRSGHALAERRGERRRDASYLVWVDDQRRPSVELLHLIVRHQVGHAHGLPALLVLPQHRVQSRQQRSDVSLLPLDPVQDLNGTSNTSGRHIAFCLAIE